MRDQHKARVRARKKSALLNRAHDSHDSEWWETNWSSSHPSHASACAACGVRAVESSRACWLRGVRRSVVQCELAKSSTMRSEGSSDSSALGSSMFGSARSGSITKPLEVDHLARFWKTATLRPTKMRFSFPIIAPALEPRKLDRASLFLSVFLFPADFDWDNQLVMALRCRRQ